MGQVGRDRREGWDRCGDGTGVGTDRWGRDKSGDGTEPRGVCRACLYSGPSGQGRDPGKLPWVPGEALERAVEGVDHDA